MSAAMSVTGGGRQLRQDFERDGFIAVRPLFDAARMAEINRELDRYLRDVVPKMSETEVYYEDKADKSTVKQMMFLERYDAYFADLLKSGAVHELAETVLGEPAIAQNMEYFNKPPGIGKQTPPHQDGYYFKIAPPQAVTGWLALEPVDDENGCLNYVRGSHRGEDVGEDGRIRRRSTKQRGRIVVGDHSVAAVIDLLALVRLRESVDAQFLGKLCDLGLRRSDPGAAEITVVAVRERMVQRPPADPVPRFDDDDGVPTLLNGSRRA